MEAHSNVMLFDPASAAVLIGFLVREPVEIKWSAVTADNLGVVAVVSDVAVLDFMGVVMCGSLVFGDVWVICLLVVLSVRKVVVCALVAVVGDLLVGGGVWVAAVSILVAVVREGWVVFGVCVVVAGGVVLVLSSLLVVIINFLVVVGWVVVVGGAVLFCPQTTKSIRTEKSFAVL